MSGLRSLKLLLLEPDSDDACLLAEAIAEMDASGRWVRWMPIDTLRLESLEDSLACLRETQFDAVLLNPRLPEGPAAFQAFLEIRAAAQHTPILVLTNDDDDSLAACFLRNGAQDVLLKRELDSLPLARAIRNAIERERMPAPCPSCADGLRRLSTAAQ